MNKIVRKVATTTIFVSLIAGLTYCTFSKDYVQEQLDAQTTMTCTVNGKTLSDNWSSPKNQYSILSTSCGQLVVSKDSMQGVDRYYAKALADTINVGYTYDFVTALHQRGTNVIHATEVSR